MKKLLFKSIMSSVLFLPALAVSCVKTEQKNSEVKLLKINLLGKFSPQYEENFKTELQKQLQKRGLDNQIELKASSDSSYEFLSQQLLKNEISLAFMSATSIYQNIDEFKQKCFEPYIQTLTNAFKGDLVNDFYEQPNGLKLQEIASNEFKVYSRIPRAQWNNKENGMNWNGTVYVDGYQNLGHDLVDFQRGIIVLVATPEQISEIKQAWNNKDWKSFSKFQIGIGKPSSGSKYQLPNLLFKKHFNKAGNNFVSLKNTELVEKNAMPSSLNKMNKDTNIHIFFENEGYYLYKQVQNPDVFSPDPASRPNQVVDFLTVTDPIPYNVGVFNNNLSKAQKEAIAETFKVLKENNQNTWGDENGFNGFKTIKNTDEFWNNLTKVYEDK
ncbi:ABC transporter thiamine pyrophosphate-binding lipoprotein p37/Cypl [Mycoplasma corogypsi]|uniref:ABC transporter thiamine pyrophosphate-binding lipoprotein p37/Cypl n=1 Tax=Mycoplasma corogypsi TaxID=2106 RepID=UPI003872DF88